MRPPPSALAAADEARRTLRRDAEALLPERFTSPEGPVQLTFALLKTAPAEESAALHAAQEALDKASCGMPAALAPRPAGGRPAEKDRASARPWRQARAYADRTAAAQSARAKALEAQCAEARAALPYPPAGTKRAGRAGRAGSDRTALRAGMDAAASALHTAQQDYAAAKAAVDALRPSRPRPKTADLPAARIRSAELTAARRTALAAQEKAPGGPPPAQPEGR